MYKIVFFALIFLLNFSCGNQEEKQTSKKGSDNSMFEDNNTNNNSDFGKRQDLIFNDTVKIKLTPFVPNFEGLGESSQKLLKDRLNAGITKIGFGGEGSNPRFIIGPSISLVSQNITSTAPTKFANSYEMNLMIVDVVSETIFASFTKEFKGVGDSPEKAFISGFRNIKFDDPMFLKFIKEAEDKIYTFFNNNCASFLQQAASEAGMRNFENAFTILSDIPVEATSCFEKVKDLKLEYFQSSLNVQCNEILNSMRAELGKYNDPSASGFNEKAMSYYALIDKQSECYGDAQKEYQTYIKKLDPKQKRDWEFKVKEYEDNLQNMIRQQAFDAQEADKNRNLQITLAEVESKTEIAGNKKLLAKYKHDESPWLIRLFSSGAKLIKGEMNTN